MNVEFGVQARDVLDHLGQKIRGNRRDHADPQPAGQPVLRRTREIAELVHRTQDVADALQQLSAELRQCDLSRVALDQRAAERPFHFLDLHRQCRLRDRTGIRRAAEMAVPNERIEIAKLAQCDIYHGAFIR